MALMPYEECLRLLATTAVGRVAFATGGEIVILPVNYAMDGSTVVFRSEEGAKLSPAQEAKTVAFEIDGWDPNLAKGWSVILNGRADAVYDGQTGQRLSRLGPHRWGKNPAGGTWIAIRPNTVTGRRIAPG